MRINKREFTFDYVSMPPGPVPFWLKQISKIRAPFAPNLGLSFPDFPPDNLFSQAHFLW